MMKDTTTASQLYREFMQAIYSMDGLSINTKEDCRAKLETLAKAIIKETKAGKNVNLNS